MSPRRVDPQIPTALIEAAALILAEEGAGALSTRRLAHAVGTSTMAVYTHFGGMDSLVRAMVHEGFARLNERLTSVRVTDDPVADVVALGWAYRHNALQNPHLYAVMFGNSQLGGFSLTDEDRQHGRYTLGVLVQGIERCLAAGRFQANNAEGVAHLMWIAVHGLVTLEIGGYLISPFDADTCFEAQVRGLQLAAGDDPEAADRSLRLGREQHAADNRWRGMTRGMRLSGGGFPCTAHCPKVFRLMTLGVRILTGGNGLAAG